MTSASKAFGRSLPRDMQEERAAVRVAAGLPAVEKAAPLWRVNDSKAGKSGPCQAVYWVKERPVTTELTRHSGKSQNEKQWQTGSVYKGEWQGNRKHGYGAQIWANGNKYEGEWANGNREGHGVFWLKETVQLKKKDKEEERKTNPIAAAAASAGGKPPPPAKKLRRVYAGNWKNDMKDGIGVYFYPDGSRYEGSWSQDMRSGRGTLYYPNGDVYTGSWSLDKQNGFGTLTKANKDVYEGGWLNGMREGSGIYYYKAQEKIYDAEWVNDQPKCGVYCDAKEFFDDSEEERRYAAAQGAVRLGRDGKPLSDEEQAKGLAAAAQQAAPDVVSPRVPRAHPPGGRTLAIPRLRMEDADAVLATAIEGVAVERAAVRALPHTPLVELFNPASLDALRRLFGAYDHSLDTGNGSGQLHLCHLRSMLGELSLPPLDEPAYAQLLTDLRKQPTERMDFAEFVRAVHLVEEAKNLAQQQQQMQQQDE